MKKKKWNFLNVLKKKSCSITKIVWEISKFWDEKNYFTQN